jgi:hypothetical protein
MASEWDFNNFIFTFISIFYFFSAKVGVGLEISLASCHILEPDFIYKGEFCPGDFDDLLIGKTIQRPADHFAGRPDPRRHFVQGE